MKLALALLVLLLLGALSLFVGASSVPLKAVFEPSAHPEAIELLKISRFPRTIATLLAGASMGTVGLIMQMIAKNRFAEPSTTGTVESATLGILCVTLLAPSSSVLQKMLVATAFALAGSFLFLQILRQIRWKTPLIVPIVGLMLGGVISAITTFFAYRHDLLQSLAAWTTGDFSGVLRGRYELLWISFGLTVAAYLAANRFTVIGLGEAFATNLGINYRRTVSLGLFIVSAVTAVVLVTVGSIPFLGLVVPNVVSLLIGDNARKALPWIAIGGGALVLICDILGRVIRYPYEIPVGSVVGILGSGLFLVLLLNRRSNAH